VAKREEVAALHALCAAGKDIGGPWGFGTRHIKGAQTYAGIGAPVLDFSVLSVQERSAFCVFAAAVIWLGTTCACQLRQVRSILGSRELIDCHASCAAGKPSRRGHKKKVS